MKSLPFTMKMSLLMLFFLVVKFHTYSEIIPDAITTISLPDENTGIIPEEIIYIDSYNKFYVFGNSKLVIIEYNSNEAKYEVIGKVELFTELEPNDVKSYGINIYPKFGVTLNTPAPNKYMTYNEIDDKLYVLRPDFKVVEIDVTTDENQGVIISHDANFLPYSFDNSKISYNHNKIFWAQEGMLSGSKKNFFGIYDMNNNFSQIISNPYFPEYSGIHDFMPNDDYVYIMMGSAIQKRLITPAFNTIVGQVENTEIGNGRLLFSNANNKLYAYGLGSSIVYSINPDDFSYDEIDNIYQAQITCVTFDNINNLLYLGTNQNDNDIFIYRYNFENDNYNFITSLATNFEYPNNEDNKPYYLFQNNGKIYISKPSEIVRIDYTTEDHFSFTQLVKKIDNYFYGCALDTYLNNILVTNFEGVIHQINEQGEYMSGSDIQVGIKVNDACFIPFSNLVCFYTRDLFEDNHLVVYNNELGGSL